MKGTTWEGGFREPAIVRYPRAVRGGQRLTQLVSTMDIFVTALELAEASLPSSRPLDGQSLIPILRDGAESRHTSYFYWRGNAVFAMRHGDYKLHFMTQGCTDYWHPQLKIYDPPLLFHVLRDPSEAFPLDATAPAHAAVIVAAKAALSAHMAAVAADTTKAPPQLNRCNPAKALWPPKQRHALAPPDLDMPCSY